MPWPIPTAKQVAEKLATTLEQTIQTVRQVDPVALSRAVRSARGMFAMLLRAISLELRAVHDHLAWWGRMYFPDTAEDEFVARHADIWGISARPATAAVGSILIEGAPGTALPANLEFSASDGLQFVTLQATVIAPDGSVLVAAKAAQDGRSGNLEANIRLRTVTPFPAIDKATVGPSGFSGGAEADTPAELAAATLAHIRQRPHGGAGFDYPTWLREQFDVRAVKTVTDWVGRGSVGVIVAMKDGLSGRAPTPEEMAEQLDYLGAPGSALGVRPVTANVIIVPVELRELTITVRVRPDSIATRHAIEEAWKAFVLTIGDASDDQNAGPIGCIIEPSRISEAISAASGEYAHDLLLPAARFVLERDQYPIAGPVTFLEPL